VIDLRDVAAVRAAERDAGVEDGHLMQHAASALAVACASLLRGSRGRVVGSTVVALVGPGDNGGDALFAAARLAGRGCRVVAVTVVDRWHESGARALRRAGGRLVALPGDEASTHLAAADLVLDGIVGIGASGGLRAPGVAEAVAASDAIVVAVDLPSGVDADTGEVPGTVVAAYLTLTFGAVKPGLVIAPGGLAAGAVRIVDLGLEFDRAPAARMLESDDVADWVPEPSAADHKYRRAVVGIAAGSAAYPGAAHLAVAAARHADTGMVRILDRGDGVARSVVDQYPDVVMDGSPPAEQERADAWGCGPGFAGTAEDRLAVAAVLAAPVPVVVDAGALAVVDPDLTHRAAPTVLTPHEGEFERLFPGLLAGGRWAAAREAARRSGAVIVLKGPGTIIAGPTGVDRVDGAGTAALATAGSGDVLTGTIAAVLAGAWRRGRRAPEEVVDAVAAAVWLLGTAGRLASEPATAVDIAAAIGAAVRVARFGAP
jgi:hydroxyethylthiazole kinase-like uncharacterized protein yjeF